MGRVSLIGQQPSAYSLMDLYRYSAKIGVRAILAVGASGSLSTAYFSIDNGVTRLLHLEQRSQQRRSR